MAITTIGMLFTARPVLAENEVPSAISSASVSSSANEMEESVTAGSGSGTGGSSSAKEDFSRTTEAGSNPSETKETSEKSEEEIEEKEREDAQEMTVVSYAAHVQRTGWPDKEVISGETAQTYAGSTGRGLRVEAIRASVKGDQNLGITYNTYVQRKGWTGWQSDGAAAGTTGQSLRAEAIVMKLTGDDEKKYDLY